MSSESSDQQLLQQRPGPVRLSTMAIRPSEPEHLPCPRCDSTNTKFCYYNNYNLSQPRHFCKACRRYWTRGGTLRNVPVGGGSRKSSVSASSHKRPRTTTAATSMSPTATAAMATAATATTGATSSSEDIAHHHNEPLHANPVSPMMSQMGSGSVSMSGSLMGCDVNLNEAVPEASNFGSFLTSHVGSGLLPFGNGFGLGLGSGIHGLGFGLGTLDWPMDSLAMGHHHGNNNSNAELGGSGGGVIGNDGDGNGNGSASGGSSAGGCNTWQLGGGVEASLGDDGDCFGWPDLAISMPGKGLK